MPTTRSPHFVGGSPRTWRTELGQGAKTGRDGGGGTVHANNPADVPARLEALAALGGLDRAALHSQLAAAVLSQLGPTTV
jgi:Flp pilus assembly CpaF family ATPase